MFYDFYDSAYKDQEWGKWAPRVSKTGADNTVSVIIGSQLKCRTGNGSVGSKTGIEIKVNQNLRKWMLSPKYVPNLLPQILLLNK